MTKADLDKCQNDLRQASYFESTMWAQWEPYSWSQRARSFLEELYKAIPNLWPIDSSDFESLTENTDNAHPFYFCFMQEDGDRWIDFLETNQGFLVEYFGEYAETYQSKTKEELFSTLRGLVQ